MRYLIFILLFIPLFVFSQDRIKRKQGWFEKTVTDTITTSETDKDLLIDPKGTGETYMVGNVYYYDVVHLFHCFADSAYSFTFDGSRVYYHLTNDFDSLFLQIENDGFTVSNDTITVLKFGDYDFVCQVNAEGSSNQAYTLRFYNITQATAIHISISETGQGVNDYFSISVNGYLEDVAAGDKIVVQIKNEDGTGALTIRGGIIRITLIHI